MYFQKPTKSSLHRRPQIRRLSPTENLNNMPKSKKETVGILSASYFNDLFQYPPQTPKTIQLINLINTYRIRKKILNPFLSCPAEEIQRKDVRKTLSLKTYCLITLHKELVYRSIFMNEMYLSFFATPMIIFNLNIPRTLIDELLYLIVTCPRHCNLHTKVPLPFNKIQGYLIEPKSEIYQILHKKDKLKETFLFTIWLLPELTYKLRYVTGIPHRESEYESFSSYIKTQCKLFIYKY